MGRNRKRKGGSRKHMGKKIKLSQQDIESTVSEIKASLVGNPRISNGSVAFSKRFDSDGRKATLYFTEIAWLKMQTLIKEFSGEVGWHGLAYRGNDETKDDYFIADILVYPQEVSGSTVNTDQEKYQAWLYSQEDDVFNNIRFQGHSHVNMGVTPSTTDDSLYERILGQLEDDMFYIFAIWNKKGDRTVMIYDMKKNTLFDGKDVTVAILNDGTGIEKFMRDAKELVKQKSYSYGSSYGNYGSYGSYGSTSSQSSASSGSTSASDGEKSKKSKVDPDEAQLSIYGGGMSNECDYDDLADYGRGYPTNYNSVWYQ